MLVYRIEDRDGRGAFRELYRLHDDHACSENLTSAFAHPAPQSFEERGTNLSAFNPGDLFGCRSKPQLRMWFRSPKGRAAMAEAGGKMVTYWVPDEHVKRGRYQVAFDPNHATKISTVPANEW